MPRATRGPRESIADRRARRAAVDDPAEVLAAAARLLEARPRSTDEIRQRLRFAGYRTDLVETALERLTELGYLDDAAFAQAWVESRDRAQPRGARALRDELRRKGVAAGDAEAALAAREALASGDDPDDPRLVPGAGERASSDASDDAAAARLLARRQAGLLREPDSRKRRARAYSLLARAGFDPGHCRARGVGLARGGRDAAGRRGRRSRRALRAAGARARGLDGHGIRDRARPPRREPARPSGSSPRRPNSAPQGVRLTLPAASPRLRPPKYGAAGATPVATF